MWILSLVTVIWHHYVKTTSWIYLMRIQVSKWLQCTLLRIFKGTGVFLLPTPKRVNSIILLTFWVKQRSGSMLYTTASQHLPKCAKIMELTLCIQRRKIITVPLNILSSVILYARSYRMQGCPCASSGLIRQTHNEYNMLCSTDLTINSSYLINVVYLLFCRHKTMSW